MSFYQNPIRVLDPTESNSASSGALVVDGGVGIGGDLHVAGNSVSFRDNFVVLNDGATGGSVDSGLLFARHSTDVSDNKNYAGMIYQESDDRIKFGYISSDPERGSSALISMIDVEIGNTTVHGHLVPSTNVTYDLGNSSLRWRDLWLSGDTIHLGEGVSIQNSGGAVSLGDSGMNVASVSTGTLSANIASTGTLVATSVTSGTLSASTLVGAIVSAGTLAAGSVSGGSLSASTLVATTVSAGTLVATTVTGGSIATGTIVGVTVSAGTLVANVMSGGNISVSGTVSAGSARFAGDVLLSGATRNIGTSSAHDLRIRTGNTDRITVTSTGNVGIGTTSPSRSFFIQQVGSTQSQGWDSVPIEGYSVSGGSYLRMKRSAQSNGEVGYAWVTGTGVESPHWVAYCPTSSTDLRFYGGGGDRLTLKANGNVGIGTASPVAPLDVNGFVEWGGDQGSGYFFSYGIGTLNSWNNNNAAVSIRSTHAIWTNDGFVAASDTRIKRDLIDIVDASALETLRLLQPKTYGYIDILKKGDKSVYGFSAQQVRQVLPHAVSLQSEYVPNVYSIATVGNNGTRLMLPQSVSTSVLQNQVTDGSMSIPIRCYIDENDTELITNVIGIIDDHTVEIDTPIANSSGNVFIYGQEVNDFHTLNKDYIWTVATAALQEVDRQLQAEKTAHDATAQELANVRTELNAVTALLQAKFPGEI